MIRYEKLQLRIQCNHVPDVQERKEDEPVEDIQIIQLFFARSEQAITELDAKYGGVCHKLSYQILNNQLDAEECVNDAYLGAWNAIPPERPNPLLTFLCKIVRNLSINRYHANTAIKRNSFYDVALSEVEQDLVAPETVEGKVEAKELARLIETFLDSLNVENRVIFMRRYWFADSYSEIASRVGVTEKTVSVRLTRMRKQLRSYLTKQGVFV